MTKILAAVVIYRQQPSQTSTMRTLRRALAEKPEGLAVSIFLADNSPVAQVMDPLPTDVTYRRYPHNPGLAEPYNEAIKIAEDQGIPWLLTLDQDTTLPALFFVLLEPLIRRFQDDASVSTIAPRVLDGTRAISPFYFAGNFLPRVLSAARDGLAPRHASAINSAALHRVAALRGIGGFDPEFPLHNSDTRLFQLLDRAGKRIALAPHVQVQHELSILQRETRMTPERYKANLVDECRFWDLHMGRLARLERLLRLMLRSLRSLLQGEGQVMRSVTQAEVKRRLKTLRRQRLRHSL